LSYFVTYNSLEQGLPAPIVGAMAETASIFFSFNEFQELIRRATNRPLSEKASLPQLALAAAGAGFVTSFFLCVTITSIRNRSFKDKYPRTPIELVKCKMQVQMLVAPAGPAALPGPLSVLATVVRNDGLRGLWLGQTATLVRETGGTAAWLGTKEIVGRLLSARRAEKTGKPVAVTSSGNVELLPWESALSGACAGAAFNMVLFPADTVKSTIQTEEELRPTRQASGGQAPSKPTFLGTARALYRAQGIRGLYAGCGITIARSIPSSAIIFLIYDGLNKHFG
jgi:mitochondrial ornithine carrier protein